jgi:hypothetical protein
VLGRGASRGELVVFFLECMVVFFFGLNKSSSATTHPPDFPWLHCQLQEI